MKLLITGAHGFVGVNLVRWLAETLPDAHIIAADLHPPDPLVAAFLAPVAARVEHAVLDVTDRAAFVQLATEHQITHLVHAAAVTPSYADEQRNPVLVVDVNLGGAVNTLEAAISVPSIERAVLLSSSGVYGAPTGNSTVLQPEHGPLQLDNLYSITKYSAELLGARYAAISGKSIVAVRLAAMYGPMERPTASRIGMSQPQHLLVALREGRSVRVAGPEVVRDWMYIEDTAAALRALLLAPCLRHNVYNAGGAAYTFGQLVEIFTARGLHANWTDNADEADIALRPESARAPLAMARLRADTSFAPQYTLYSGIAAWFNRADIDVTYMNSASVLRDKQSGW